MLERETAGASVNMDVFLSSRGSDFKYESGVVVVDLGAISRNYARIKSHISPTTVAPVLKSNAYGLGADRVFKALFQSGAKEFFVATLNEGVAARNAVPDAKIYVLYGLCFDSEELFFQSKIIPVLNTYDQLVRWNSFAVKNNKILDCVLHVDTGMSRTGLCRDGALRVIQDLHQMQNINVTYVMSHLCCGENADFPTNKIQLEAFERFSRHFPQALRSLSATPAIYSAPSVRLDMARIGYGLYGSYEGTPSVPLEQAMHVYSRIVQLRTTYPGDTVGYGASYVTTQKGRLATLSMGYADGYLRFLHKYKPRVRIGPYWASLVGRISMDFCVVDVSHIPDVYLHEGAWVQMLGSDIRVADLIQDTDFVPHEIPISLGKRYHWEYLD